MPRLRRRLRDRLPQVNELIASERMRQLLLSGCDFLFLASASLDVWPQDEIPDEVIRQAWQERRDEILAAFAAEHPGERPWAFWEFSAPEPRRIREVPIRWKDTITGEWRMHISQEAEPERDYLERHGLLTEGECLAFALPQ